MDKSAVGHDYIAKVEKHASQTDCAKGFGGKFGVQTDRIDKVNKRSKNHCVNSDQINWITECGWLGLSRETCQAWKSNWWNKRFRRQIWCPNR